MISEHASPLGMGDQHAHVADLSKALAEVGHEVRVYTRRTSPGQAEVVPVAAGVRVIHLPAGPARPLPDEELLPHMAEFARLLGEHWQSWTPDVVHAHFWTSGLAAVTAAKQINVPVVQSFHELGAFGPAVSGPSRTGYE